MTVAEYLVDFLIKKGVTDVFGIPGGVVLELMYAFESRPEIEAHIGYHEQASSFAACGYAQVSHQLGVAYATRGPGFTNMITGIADAYSDSIPVLFITAHAGKRVGNSLRFEQDQEMDTVTMVKNITNYATVIDTVEDVVDKIHNAYDAAMNGRKGPVLLDVSSDIWTKEIVETKEKQNVNVIEYIGEGVDWTILENCLFSAKRPLMLVGDGVRQAGVMEEVTLLSEKWGVPVISSRCAQDVGSRCRNYYGYIGSHGIRYSSFIFEKADVVVVLGNRLSFPITSESYLQALKNKTVFWIDCDSRELKREIPNTIKINMDLKYAIEQLLLMQSEIHNLGDWVEVCETIKKNLLAEDCNQAVDDIVSMLQVLNEGQVLTSDVGNNEFWLSRAYEMVGCKNRILYSKSFGVLGCSIPKAIGTYYATKKPVVCFVGDQGLQLNIQEMQFVATTQLPIVICVLNNESSGMIKDRELVRYRGKLVHTTKESGYVALNVQKISMAYGIKYIDYHTIRKDELKVLLDRITSPLIIEMKIDEGIGLTPSLPKGRPMQMFVPDLSAERYIKLDSL